MNPQGDEVVQVIRLKAINDGAENVVRGVRDQVKALGVDLTQLNAVGQQTTLPFDHLAADARTAVLPFQEITSQVKQAANEAERLGQNVKNSGGGGGGFNLNQVRSVAGIAGGLASTVGGGQAVSAVSSVLGLTAALGPFGVALGIGTVALKAITDQQQEAAATAKEYVTALRGVVGLTSSEIQKRIDQLQAEKSAIVASNAQLADFSKQFDALVPEGTAATYSADVARQEAVQAKFAAIYQQLSDATNGQVTNAITLSAAIDAGNTSLDDINGNLGFFTLTLNSTATAANDAAAAAKARVDKEVAGVQKQIDVDKLTTAQREERMAQIQREIQIQGAHIHANDVSIETQSELLASIDALSAEYQALAKITETQADVLEREKNARQALTDVQSQYLDALQLEGQIRDEITATLAKMDEIIAERDAQLSQIVTEGETQRGEILADAGDRRAEIEADAGDRLQQIALDSADRIAKIMRDSGREQFAAVGARDARAFYQSKINAAAALEDQKQADARAIDQLSKSLAKQEAALDKSLDKQLSAQQKGQEKQIDQLIRATNKQVDIQAKGLAQLNVDLTNAQNAQRTITLSGTAQVISAHNQMYVDMAIAAYNNGKTIVESLINGFWSGLAGTSLPAVTGTAAQQSSFDRQFDARYSAYQRAATR